MTRREFATTLAIGAAAACLGVVVVWSVLDAYTRIAYASLGLPYPG